MVESGKEGIVMQVVSVSVSNDIEKIMFDLEAETFILELILKYGHYIDVLDDIKQRALDNITDYQRDHLQDIFRYYRNDYLVVPTACLVRELHASLEQDGIV